MIFSFGDKEMNSTNPHFRYTSYQSKKADEKPERDVLYLRRHRTRTTKYKQQLDSSKPNINRSSKYFRRGTSYV